MTLHKQNYPRESRNRLAEAVKSANQSDYFRHQRLDFFESRCNLIADRIRVGELSFIDGVDMAYSAAQWSGLIDAIGDDDVQLVMRSAFMNLPRGELS